MTDPTPMPIEELERRYDDMIAVKLALGAHVAARANGLRIDGRPFTMIEGAAVDYWRRHSREAAEEQKRIRETLLTLLDLMEDRPYVRDENNDARTTRQVAG